MKTQILQVLENLKRNVSANEALLSRKNTWQSGYVENLRSQNDSFLSQISYWENELKKY